MFERVPAVVFTHVTTGFRGRGLAGLGTRVWEKIASIVVAEHGK